MWGPCSPTITAKSILIKNTTEETTHKKCKEIERQKKKDRQLERKGGRCKTQIEKKMTGKEKYKRNIKWWR